MKTATLSDPGRPTAHAWWPHTDRAAGGHIWRCTCRHEVYQLFGSPVPDELISHPQEHGQLRGERETPWTHPADVSSHQASGSG